jgi:hypothetical protein
MYYVTVDPETGNDIITWYASPSPEIDYYVTGIRVVTAPGEPDSYLPVGIVNIPDTVFVNTNPESWLHSVGYAVWGVDVQGGGVIFTTLFDKTDSTIFLQSVFDSCEATITLNWNDYNSWRGTTSNFNVMRRTGPGNYQLLASVPYGTNTYAISNVNINEQYDLFVEAVHTDGVRVSASNRVSQYTLMSQQPSFLNADYATLSPENTIDLSFTVDAASDLTRYALYRSSSMSGPFDKIADINTPGSRITYTDDVEFRSGVFYYRLEAINNCGTSAIQSNLANNIVLNGTMTSQMVALYWNSYADWSGGVERYTIIRTQGGGSSHTDTLDPGTSLTWNDDLTTLVNYADPAGTLFCYQVEAHESLNVYGSSGESLSNRICFSVVPDIRMPNAIIPNDSDPVNQVFEPVFSFEPEHYELYIYNRLGTKIWEGTGPWNGTDGGKPVPEGVYVYLLRIYNYSSEITELTGQVTVVYR